MPLSNVSPWRHNWGFVTGCDDYQVVVDLNRAQLQTDGHPEDQKDNSARFGSTEVVFKHLRKRLCSEITQADYVLGACAWLTDEAVIEALASTREGCSVVVQKEDFLRPDLDSRDGWPLTLRALYDSLRDEIVQYSAWGLAGELSYATGRTHAPVRCVGNHNSQRKTAMPRMHNKFWIFCRVPPVCECADGRVNVEQLVDDECLLCGGKQTQYIQPYAVWTGSFNATKNGSASLENAVLIHDTQVAEKFADEWAQIFALSEPLDWTSPWVAPEYRIGS